MNSKSEKTPSVLIMLGTDTVRTHTLKKEKSPDAETKRKAPVTDYPKGETLSVIGDLIKATNPKIPEDPTQTTPYPFEANEVTVVNGPFTQGSDVGIKIGYGLAAALKAIARGQTPINVIAHSRGAVESILIGHELVAIQQMIKTGACKSVADMFKILSAQQKARWDNLPKNNTPDIIAALKEQLSTEQEQAEFFKNLQGNIEKSSGNFFGIDPVPGDCFPITWYDERFFKIPKFFKKTQIFYYENERSYLGFTPICPEPETEGQEFERHSILGFHGTGSAGNNASQRKERVGPQNQKSTHVQKLMIFKLLDFLTKNGVEFKDAREIFHKNTALGRKYILEVIEQGEVDPSKLDYPTIYRALYNKILENRKSYEAFNETSYPAMGVIRPQRNILRAGHKYGKFNDVFVTNMGGYINKDHARLMQDYFLKLFGLNGEPKDLAGLVSTACSVLKKNIRGIPHTKVENTHEENDLTGSFIFIEKEKETTIQLQEVREDVLCDDKAREDVLSTFKVVIQQISQQYLTKDWSSTANQEEKKKLFAEVTTILKTFDELSTLKDEKGIIAAFVKQLQESSFAGITQTVQSQHAALDENFNYLQTNHDEQLKHFFNGLLAQANNKELDSNIDADLLEIMNSEAFKHLENHPIETKINHIVEELISSDKLTEEKHGDIIKNRQQLPIDFQEHYGDDPKEFELLYQQMKILIEDLSALRKLVPSEKSAFDQYELSLRQKSSDLIDIAAQKLYKGRPADALPPIAVKGSFMGLAENHAIAHYNVVDRSKENQEQLFNELAQQQIVLEEIRNKEVQLNQQIRELTKDHATKDSDLKKHQLEKEQIDLQLKELEKNGVETKKHIKDMNTKKEALFLLLISDKLVPLTQKYLDTLNSAKPDSKNQGIRENKIEIVGKLLNILTAEEQSNKLPSKRIEEFYDELNKHEAAEKLTTHRDPEWQRYARNAVIVAGILIFGIIPGLVALAAYSAFGTNTSVRFWRPKGANWSAEIKGMQPDDQPEESEKPNNLDV